MRLIVARAIAARSLLSAAVLVALVATTLITLFLLLAWLQPIAGIRAAFTEAPANERTILVTADSGGDAEVAAQRDAAVRDLLGDGIAGVPLPVTSAGRGLGHRLPAADRDTQVMFLEDLPDHAALLDGAWPAPTSGSSEVEIALPAGVATELEIAVGDRLLIHDWVRQTDHETRVVGIWEPDSQDDPYWELTAGLGGDDLGPVVVDPEVFLDRFRASSTLLWLAEPSPQELAEAGMDELVMASEALHARMLRERDEDPVWAQSTRMRLDLADLASALALSTVVQRSGLVLPAALLAVIAIYALALLARLLATDRRGETALLRARGASRWQLASAAGVEGILVVAPAALLAAPLAIWTVSFLDARAGGASLDLSGDLAAFGALGPSLGWLVAALVAAGCAFALALPAAKRGRTWVAEQQQRSRPRRGAVLQRAGIDVGLVVLAAIGWLQLRRYGAGAVPREVGGIGVDPVLTMAPVVAVLAATVVALRLLPVATRSAVRIARGREGFPSLLGAWQADRRPHAGPVVLLVLAVATAVLAPSVAATWQQSQRDQAAHQVGADVRLEGRAGDIGSAIDPLPEQVGVEEVMAVSRSTARLGEAGYVPRLAIDSASAAGVVHMRSDLATAGTAATFAPLREGRPSTDGVPLPHGTQRLRGTLHITWDGDLEDLQGGASSLLVADADGLITTVPLARPDVGEPYAFDVELPDAAASLIGVRGGFGYLRAPSMDPQGSDGQEVVWEVADLAAGSEDEWEPLDLPETWTLDLGPGWRPGPRRLAPEQGGRGSVGATVLPHRHGSQQVNFQLIDDAEVPTVPALFTEAALDAAGGSEMLGTEVDLGGLVVEVAGTVPALPGSVQDEAVVVDLTWLSQRRAKDLEPTPSPNELWIATAPDAASGDDLAGMAQRQGLTIHDSDRAAARLLADPQGAGVLQTLWAAAAAAIALAAFGLVIDARATAVQRRRELAFLHTLGASPPALARSLVVEQALLAGLGVAAGIAVGLGVAVTMGPSLVMTPTGGIPVPEPLASFSIGPFIAPTGGLFVVAVVLGALVARRARREVTAGALRIGED